MDSAWIMGAKAENPVAMKLQVRRRRNLGDCKRGCKTTKALSVERVPICGGVGVGHGNELSTHFRGFGTATHHGPVELLEMRLAVEADVDARDEGPEDLKHDGHVVEAHPQVPVVAGVAEHGVVER